MSNIIYTSEKVLPYVYLGIHKITNHFYIGSRYAQTNYINKGLASHIDLGKNYFTSSKTVKQLGFDNFNWIILAEFFNWQDAYEFEQQLIFENIKNPLILNKRAHINNKWATIPGVYSLANKSDEEKKQIYKKQSASAKNRTFEEKQRTKQQTTNTIKNWSPEQKQQKTDKWRETMLLKTPEEKQKELQKQITTAKSRTKEQNVEIAKKSKATQDKQPEHIKLQRAQNRSNKVKQQWANKTEEELLIFKQNASKRQKGIPKGPYPKVTCPHCQKEGGINVMKRHHFDNCKKLK